LTKVFDGFYYGYMATQDTKWVDQEVDWADCLIERAVKSPTRQEPRSGPPKVVRPLKAVWPVATSTISKSSGVLNNTGWATGGIFAPRIRASRAGSPAEPPGAIEAAEEDSEILSDSPAGTVTGALGRDLPVSGSKAWWARAFGDHFAPWKVHLYRVAVAH
jgi:hypothetical protein